MSLQAIDASMVKKMFLAGAKNLEKNRDWINELNVFPVPDGDTGTNMTMTIMSAAKEVAALPDNATMEEVCKAISGGSLRGARGNSGVILSQLFRGFTKIVKGLDTIDLPTFADAFDKAVDSAYKAVMKPKEGTILTVARGFAEKSRELALNNETDLEKFFRESIENAEYVLSQTPEMLPVLKEAGVVDSGGQGLVCVFRGAFDLYLGKEIDLTISDENSEAKKEEASAPNLKFVYNCDYRILLSKNFNIKQEMDFKDFLESIGSNVDCKVVDDNKVCVHLATNDPGLALQKALMFGDLDDINIVNMKAPKKSESSQPVVEKAPKKDVGFITVSIGEGVNEIFKSLGADYIIEGGQTMNPSTADILDAVEKVNADTVFVLPNNKNIILAANQAAELVTDKTLLVIPTKTIPQGITAIINYVPEMSVDENEANMIAEIANVKTGQVTYAVRDTNIDGKEIRKDDYMGIGDKGLISVGKDIEEVTLSMVDGMMDDSSELISIYYGADAKEEDANKIKEAIEAKYKNVDIELQMGGQPIYYYIISVE